MNYGFRGKAEPLIGKEGSTMSIEQSLESIAISLETIANQFRMGMKQPEAPVVAAEPVASTAPKATRGRPKATAPAPAPEVTVEDLTDVLKKHAAAFGVQVTLDLMVANGADAQSKKINTIPKTKWAALYNKAQGELEKVGK